MTARQRAPQATFDYHEAESLADALSLLQRYGDSARPLAGGTVLMLPDEQQPNYPAHLVGLRRVAELHGIRAEADGWLEIGALTTHRRAERSAAIRDHCPALGNMFGSIATVRVRNQATLGGNLVRADPAYDPPAMLLALNAEVILASSAGVRSIPLSEFYVDRLDAAIRLGELLMAVRVPPAIGASAAYAKFWPDTSGGYASLGMATVLNWGSDGTCESVQIGLAGLGPTALRAYTAEAALAGSRLTSERVRQASLALDDDIDPVSDLRGSSRYKRDVAAVWLKRMIGGLMQGRPQV